MTLSVDLTGEDMVRAIQANPAREYLVVERTGEIVGVLSTADVERAFASA
jgi:CBS domain-containing protein